MNYRTKTQKLKFCTLTTTEQNSPNLMPVVIEKAGHLTGYGEVISIAHYGEQNGDLMADVTGRVKMGHSGAGQNGPLF